MRYRIETAKSDVESVKILYEAGVLRGVNNRAYYGIYHAISAIHALANFNKNYVKTEVFPRTQGRKIAEAAEIRHASDYDDFYIATKEEAQEQIGTAEELTENKEESF